MLAFYCKIFNSLNESVNKMLQSQGKVFDKTSQNFGATFPSQLLSSSKVLNLQELFEDIGSNHKFRNEKLLLWLNYLENRE